ncbi:MAG: hypothetical protein LBP76_08495 [Treponema sp.]|jgi:hypothetical protein|nr:hypothetical protein [Treponema sp.]
MKKMKIMLASAALFLCAALAGAQSMGLDRALDTCVAEIAARLPAGTRVACPRINAPSGELADYVTGRLTARLIRDTRFIVVNRERAPVTAEIDYQLSGNVSDETAVSITAQLGAEAVIAGALRRAGGRFHLDIRAIMVERNTVAAQWSAEVEGGEWARLAGRRAGLVFDDGGRLSESDKKTLLEGLQRGLQTKGNPLTLASAVKDAEQTESGESFTVRVEWEEKGNLIVGTANVTLNRGDEARCVSRDYHVSELGVKRYVQRIAEQIRADRQFFDLVNGELVN